MFFNNKFNIFFGLNLTLVYTFPCAWHGVFTFQYASTTKVRDDLVMNPVTCQYESLFIETVMHDHKVLPPLEVIFVYVF